MGNDQPTSAQPPSHAEPPPPGQPWGSIATDTPIANVTQVASKLARKGKLPGFSKTQAAFCFTGFGEPFDYFIDAVQGEGQVVFHPRLQRKLPIIFAVVTLLTIWPGCWLTDSMLRTYFTSYDFSQLFTYAWYIPLTVVPLLWMIPRMLRKSRNSAYAHSLEKIALLDQSLRSPE